MAGNAWFRSDVSGAITCTSQGVGGKANTSAPADYILAPSAGVTVVFVDSAGVSRTWVSATGNLAVVLPGGIQSITSVSSGSITVATGTPSPGSVGAGPNWTTQNAWALVTGTAYVATAGELVSVNTGGATTVTLPTAVGIAGQRIRVQDATGTANTHNITIATTSSQTINGTTPAAIATANGGNTYVSNGANWVLGS
jgi:hypothetical protein